MGSGGGPGHGSIGAGDSTNNENDADKAHEGEVALDWALPQGYTVKVELDQWE